MTRTSDYLEKIITQDNRICNCMQVVFVDIVSYSERQPYAQLNVIDAFMRSLEESISETAKEFIKYTNGKNIILRRDMIILPSGDGAAIGFPFEGVRNMHLFFAKDLIKSLHKNNMQANCTKFNEKGWCDCHNAFNLRIGISEGLSIVYNDINNNYNIAGNAINMSARVMDVADSNQIFITKKAYSRLKQLIPNIHNNFVKYDRVKIKHDLKITVYQYVNDKLEGLNSLPNETLELEERATNLDDNELEEPGSSNRETVTKNVRLLDNSLQTEVVSKAKNILIIDKPLKKEMQERMVEIPAGEFTMGDKNTGHVVVKISRPFLMDKYPVTQALYQKVMNKNPSIFNGEDLPVENINWFEAINFCNKLSKMCALQEIYDVDEKKVTINYEKNGYRLPTEAEWEYACCGNTTEERYGELDDIAWYSKNSGKQSQDVGQKLANEFGLFDMLGNVWEWCNDWYDKAYPENSQEDYKGPKNNSYRILRGGSWANFANIIGSAHRDRKHPLTRKDNRGFRLVLTSNQ